MNFGLAFSFVFQDRDWLKKILIPALVSLIPILGQIVVLGWGLEVTRRVIRRDPVTLPELDFGTNLATGFMGWLIGFIYALPIIILTVPFSLLTAMPSSDSSSANAGLVALSLCFSVVVLAYALLLALALPAALGNYVATGSFGAAFDLGKVWGLVRSAPGAYLLAFLGTLVGSLIASLGVILCVVGILFTAAYYSAVMGHLYGQAYRAAAPIAPAVPTTPAPPVAPF